MTQFYTIKTAGSPPLELGEVKSYLKISNNASDGYLELLIDAVTEFGEKYTFQQFRANTWTLLVDSLSECIELRRPPVTSITNVKYTVGGVLTTIPSSTYYLKKKQMFPSILLGDGESWPTDGDNADQGVEIEFVSEPVQQISIIKRAMLAHIASLYRNRGDCKIEDAAQESGAIMMYDMVSLPRI